MKTVIILFTLILTSCQATGESYRPNTANNLVVYRKEGALYAASWIPLKINGLSSCRISHKGFYTTYIEPKTNITADWWDTPGTSSIVANPGDFIKVEIKNSTIWAQEGGVMGAGVREAAEGGGPFQFIKVPRETAERELAVLHRDCI